MSACAASGSRVYVRRFQEPPEVLWSNTVQKIQLSGEQIKKIDNQKQRMIIRRSLTINELYQCAASTSLTLVDDGDAEIELWVEPDPAGGSLLKSQAALYSMTYDYLRLRSVSPLQRPLSLGYAADYETERQTRELTPVALESNGLLEMHFLGYSEEEARNLLRTQEVQSELEKVREWKEANLTS